MALMLLSLLITIPMILGHEDPKELEDWFLKVRRHNEKVTKLHFYFHGIQNGENLNSVEVAHANISDSSPTDFGRVTMIDYPLTVEPILSSKLVGRAQGLFASASMHDDDLFMSMNIVFDDGEFNRSSLAVLGHNPFLHSYREMAIVGGSGAFRLARGVVILKTHLYNVTTEYAIVGVDVVTIHH